jgi:hypothetical protein
MPPGIRYIGIFLKQSFYTVAVVVGLETGEKPVGSPFDNG